MKTELNGLPEEIVLHVAKVLGVPVGALRATVGLLDEGGTVPFVARYRKEATGGLDEVKIREIAEQVEYFRDLLARRAVVLKSVEEQGKLTAELRAKIEGVMDKGELEDLYLPYKPKRRTKATIAREKGLEPLADYLWGQVRGEKTLMELAAGFVTAEVGSVGEALEGARHIVAERVAETAEVRKALREWLFADGVIVSRRTVDGGGRARQIQDVLRVS